MRDVHPREIQIYRTPNGQQPFTQWLESIRGVNTRDRIQARADRLKFGNFGDYKSVGDGVCELRLNFGPGYRIYFGQVRNKVVLLLCGGDKSSQARDIERAKTYWLQYKEAHL